MMDPTRIKNISANFMRAQQAEAGGDITSELRFLLFAADDIIEVLKEYRTDLIFAPRSDGMDPTTANRYAESLAYTSKRVGELINHGV